MRVGSIVFSTEQVGVYCIRNTVNGKRYIGSTVVLRQRFKSHKSRLRKGTHVNKHLQAAWNKYGEHKFTFTVIKLCNPDSCISIEQKYIDLYACCDPKFGYNKAPKAGTVLGLKHSAESNSKISASVKQYWKSLSKEDLKKASEVRKGRKLSPAAREKIRVASTGRKHSNKTKQKMSKIQKELCSVRNKTDEHRAKLREAWVRRKARGWKMSEEQKIKTAAKTTGQKRSKEFCEHLSASLKGKTVPTERRLRIAKTLSGRTLSDSHRASIKAGMAKVSNSVKSANGKKAAQARWGVK